MFVGKDYWESLYFIDYSEYHSYADIPYIAYMLIPRFSYKTNKPKFFRGIDSIYIYLIVQNIHMHMHMQMYCAGLHTAFEKGGFVGPYAVRPSGLH